MLFSIICVLIVTAAKRLGYKLYFCCYTLVPIGTMDSIFKYFVFSVIFRIIIVVVVIIVSFLLLLLRLSPTLDPAVYQTE